jgi:hypothetical protein
VSAGLRRNRKGGPVGAALLSDNVTHTSAISVPLAGWSWTIGTERPKDITVAGAALTVVLKVAVAGGAAKAGSGCQHKRAGID